MLQVDWTTLLDRFKEKYGEHLHDNRLPYQSYYEAFEEKLSDGHLTGNFGPRRQLARRTRPKGQAPRAFTTAWSPPGLFPYDPDQAPLHVAYAVIDRRTQTEIQSHDAHVAVGADEATDKAVLQ